MSDRERTIWRMILRVWLAAAALWTAAFAILDLLGGRPALMYAAFAGLALAAAAFAFLRYRHNRTAETRAELTRVSKTQWKRTA